MQWTLFQSIEHLKELSAINGRAEFYIILSGGWGRSGKEIHYDKASRKFEIFNEIDGTWQSDVTENELHSKTIIPQAIEKSSMFYCGYQLWGI